jgi:hypothetical protein
VRINQLAHVLSLIRALLHNVAVVLEQVVDEELVEQLCQGALSLMLLGVVLVDFAGEGLAEDERVHEAP